LIKHDRALAEIERIAIEATTVPDAARVRDEAWKWFNEVGEVAGVESERGVLRLRCLERGLRAVHARRPSEADVYRLGAFVPPLEPPRYERFSPKWRRAWLTQVLDCYPLDPARPGASSEIMTDREIALVSLLLSSPEDFGASGTTKTFEQLVNAERRAINGIRLRRGEISARATELGAENIGFRTTSGSGGTYSSKGKRAIDPSEGSS
jgi:hypothetical protein